MTSRRFGERSPELVAALAAADDPRDVTLGLPERVEGDCEFTVVAGDHVGGMQAWDVAFDWDGETRYATYWFDISGHEDLSPGSSAPLHGWLSWNGDTSVVIGFADPELDVHGVAWGDGVAMIDAETSETKTAALDWAALARFLIDHVNAALNDAAGWEPVDPVDRAVDDDGRGSVSSQKGVDESLQLSIYARACRDALGFGTPERVTLYFTESALRLSTTRSDEQLDLTRADVLARVSRMRAREFAATPGRLRERCDYRAMCPERV